jgi:hypothetical protein
MDSALSWFIDRPCDSSIDVKLGCDSGIINVSVNTTEIYFS